MKGLNVIIIYYSSRTSHHKILVIIYLSIYLSPIGGLHMSRHQKLNRKHSINELKNLTCDRFLIYKSPCKDLDLCSFTYVSYLEKRFNQIYRALYGDAMLVSLEGHQHGVKLGNSNVLYCKMKKPIKLNI